ncbi:hypothetical protein FP2_02340 [Faecalibacterium prausnitzii L2-6]|uniref:Uncharacterized protein n=1 Tax=Faecalibacterium prausnitzii L2-6 TaxID=718252 RepID=D4K324_9FIRM|nr:hypothetical protein FP2_02340 [Faecalibacterium prausnitzii L2-6]
MSQMHYAYLYLFYPIPRHLARGFGKKDDENDKKYGIEPLKALPLGELARSA